MYRGGERMLFICKECGYEWFQSYNTIKIITQCPKCKSIKIAEEYTQEFYDLRDAATIKKEAKLIE